MDKRTDLLDTAVRGLTINGLKYANPHMFNFSFENLRSKTQSHNENLK
jgi:hypothetical protein